MDEEAKEPADVDRQVRGFHAAIAAASAPPRVKPEPAEEAPAKRAKKPAAKPGRIKTEEAPAAAPPAKVKTSAASKPPGRVKTEQEVAHARARDAKAAPYKNRNLFARSLDINGRLGGSWIETYCKVDAEKYPRLGGTHFICCSYTWGAGLPTAAGLDGVCSFAWNDGSVRPVFVRRGGYALEFRHPRYGRSDGRAPAKAPGKTTNGWEYVGDYRIERDEIVGGVVLSTLSETEQANWLGHWQRGGRGHLVEQARRDPNFTVTQDRLVFVRYDERLYSDIKAFMDARVAGRA